MKKLKNTSILTHLLLVLLLFYCLSNITITADKALTESKSDELVRIIPVGLISNNLLKMNDVQIINRSNLYDLINLHNSITYFIDDNIGDDDSVENDQNNVWVDQDADSGNSSDNDDQTDKNNKKDNDNGYLLSDKIHKNDQSIISDKNNGKENYEFSDELLWLARIVEAEASGEPFEGKLAVANVIINRKDSPDFPSTVYGVIFDRKYGVQFTPTENGTIYNQPSDESFDAARRILNGDVLNSQILYFVNHDKSDSKWFETREFVFKIGAHSFYR